MVRRFIVILILSFFLSSCGARPRRLHKRPCPSSLLLRFRNPTQSIIADTNTPLDTPTFIPTDTPAPTGTPAPTHTAAVTPTDTPLPTLVLPTEAVNAPARQVWDGAPTYPGNSAPGFSFRVTYDPGVWALTTDQFGFPALGHRTSPTV